MPDTQQGGRLVENVQAFCHALRHAGLPVGPAQVVDALVALRTVGFGHRADVRRALSTTLAKDPVHARAFNQAFEIFFAQPGLLHRIATTPLLSPTKRRSGESDNPGYRLIKTSATHIEDRRVAQLTDRSQTTSAREVLARKDFEQMSPAELAEAQALVRTGIASLREVATRRVQPATAGHQYDPKQSMRLMLQNGGHLVKLARRRHRRRRPPLVLICDISGSMSRYTRTFLHFAHALRSGGHRVHCFVFATRLTNVTRRLDEKNVDRALESIGADVADWDGGTRIAACLERFNVEWGRRVLAQGAIVILLSDGLECDPDSDLEFQMQRLSLTCRSLLWLNPMLRFEGFQPRASGIRRMLPYVDRFLPAHNVESLRALARSLCDTRWAAHE